MVSQEVRERANAEYRQAIRNFTNEELAWDFHCNPPPAIKAMLTDEAKGRRLNLCAVEQIRRGGSFGNWRWKYRRPPCGGKCK